jgi:hypothetical protein
MMKEDAKSKKAYAKSHKEAARTSMETKKKLIMN